MALEKKPSPITTRLAVSAPAGLGVLLLAGAVALGHSAGVFASAAGAPTQPASEAADAPDPTPKVSELLENHVAEPDWLEEETVALAQRKEEAKPDKAPKKQEKPKDENPAEAPALEQPKPEEPIVYEPPKVEQPAPPAAPSALVLNASLTEYPGKVVLTWTPFAGHGFAYYKLVRTTDGDATWPASGADHVIAAIGNPNETWVKDRPDCGVSAFYRVFAVRRGDAGYGVLAASNQASVVLPCPPPPPATVGIGLQAEVVDGAVRLAWGACASEHFNAYKVVRSMTNPSPGYPEGAGTELIAAIGDAGQVTWVDEHVASGQTWFYRVVARADNGHGTYIACQSDVVSVTIP